MATAQYFQTEFIAKRAGRIISDFCFMADKDRLARTVLVQKIYMTVYRQLQLLRSLIEEKAEIICRVDRRFTFVDIAAQQVDLVLATVNRFTRSSMLVEMRLGESSTKALLEPVNAERTPKKRAHKKASV